jgi:hypothetical protein
MLAIWVDFLMIFTLLLMPEYPWEVDPSLWCGGGGQRWHSVRRQGQGRER